MCVCVCAYIYREREREKERERERTCTDSLSIPLSMDIWGASMSLLLQTELQWTLGCMYLKVNYNLNKN